MRKLLKEALHVCKSGDFIRVLVTTQKAKTSKDKFIHVRISYNGYIINQEDIAQLFEPYYNISEEEKTIGLSFVKNTILEHGGDIYANKNEEETFIEFYLPIIA